MKPEQLRPILVVDDNHTNRTLITHRLRKLGFEVEIAQGGREAIDLFKPQRFSLVFLDIQMPEIGGFEVLQYIRSTDKTTPVVAWTCSLSKNDPYLLEAGFDAELEKPLDTTDFFTILSRFYGDTVSMSSGGVRQAEISALNVERDILSKEVVSAALDFARNIPLRLAEISELLKEGEIEECSFLTHKLRGACKMQKYTFFASILKRLQENLDAANIDKANDDLRLLQEGASQLSPDALAVATNTRP